MKIIKQIIIILISISSLFSCFNSLIKLLIESRQISHSWESGIIIRVSSAFYIVVKSIFKKVNIFSKFLEVITNLNTGLALLSTKSFFYYLRDPKPDKYFYNVVM